MQGPRPVVLSGPSGAGKSTLLKKLLKDYENIFGFSVSREYLRVLGKGSGGAQGHWPRACSRSRVYVPNKVLCGFRLCPALPVASLGWLNKPGRLLRPVLGGKSMISVD